MHLRTAEVEPPHVAKHLDCVIDVEVEVGEDESAQDQGQISRGNKRHADQQNDVEDAIGEAALLHLPELQGLLRILPFDALVRAHDVLAQMLGQPLNREGLRQKGHEEGAGPAVHKEQLSHGLLNRVGLEDLLKAVQIAQQPAIGGVGAHSHHLKITEVGLQRQVEDQVQDQRSVIIHGVGLLRLVLAVEGRVLRAHGAHNEQTDLRAHHQTNEDAFRELPGLVAVGIGERGHVEGVGDVEDKGPNGAGYHQAQEGHEDLARTLLRRHRHVVPKEPLRRILAVFQLAALAINGHLTGAGSLHLVFLALEDHVGNGGGRHAVQQGLHFLRAHMVMLQVHVPGMEHLVGGPHLRLSQGRLRLWRRIRVAVGAILGLLLQHGVHLVLGLRKVPGHRHALGLDAGGLQHRGFQLLLGALVSLEARQAFQLGAEARHGGILMIRGGEELRLLNPVEDGPNKGEDICEGEPGDLGPNQLHLSVVAPFDDGTKHLRALGCAVAQDQQIRTHKDHEAKPHQQQCGGPDQQGELIAKERHGPGARHVGAQQVRGQWIGLTGARHRQAHSLPTLEPVLHTFRVHARLGDHNGIPNNDEHGGHHHHHAHRDEEAQAAHLALPLLRQRIPRHALLAVLQLLAFLARLRGDAVQAALHVAVPAHHQIFIRDGRVLHGAQEPTFVLLHAAEVAELIPHLRRVRALCRTEFWTCEDVLLAKALVCTLHLFRLLISPASHHFDAWPRLQPMLLLGVRLARHHLLLQQAALSLRSFFCAGVCCRSYGEKEDA
mmetsp:Transcript_61140/g.145674  ORF Transcript_61140/g.145674 Transcript_61140/m.145674 type:complete len:775 (-) Transcript_61140:83-2407(-)